MTSFLICTAAASRSLANSGTMSKLRVVEEIITTAGGTLIHALPRDGQGAENGGASSMIMTFSEEDLDSEGVANIVRTWGGPPHKCSWVFDSVSPRG